MFVDVALMSTVPGKGIRTPALVAGPGAESYRTWLAPVGVGIEVVGTEPGAAATRKLLRSIVMKGLAGLVIEAMRAANAAELGPELWEELVREITAMDEAFLHRLVTGTGPHAVRRLHEMEAATELIAELGVVPHLTDGTVANLRAVPLEGLPALPVRPAPRSTGTEPR